MNFFRFRSTTQRLILIIIAGSVLMFCSPTMATMAAENLSVPEESHPGAVGLAVSGGSAGITTEYFEQAIADAILASGIFTDIENSNTARVTIPMIGASGTFSGVNDISDAPYVLNIRVIRVDTPSFSTRMTVSMDVVWDLYCTAEKTTLLHENIQSTYTGGMFEGGIIGANRVRVAMEGATRENIRIGMELLASLDLMSDATISD